MIQKTYTYYILLFLLFYTQCLFAQEGPDIVPLKINDKVRVFYGGGGQGCNVGMLNTSEGILLVDAMKDDTHEKLVRQIRKVSDLPFKYVLSTHSDFDHTGGNKLFEEKGAVTVIQEDAVYEGFKAKVNFKTHFRLTFGDEEVEMFAVKSHSNSDALIYFKNQNVLFMGDTFTNSWHPTFGTGGLEGQIKAIELAVELSDNDTKVVPGHGLVTNRDGLIKYLNDSKNWVATTGALYRKGHSVEEISQDEGVKNLIASFLVPGIKKQIPQDRIEKFIKRTISSEFIARFPISKEKLEMYTGDYGTIEKKQQLLLEGDKVLLRMQDPYTFQYELIPIAEHTFHLRASLGTKLRVITNELHEAIGFQLIDRQGEVLEYQRL